MNIRILAAIAPLLLASCNQNSPLPNSARENSEKTPPAAPRATLAPTRVIDEPLLDFNAIIDGSNSFVIRNVTLFDGESVLPHAVVTVESGRIAQTCIESEAGCPAPAASDLDGQDGFLMPSLIDSEGHFTLANEMLRDVLEENPSSCTTIDGVTYAVPSLSALVHQFSEKGLFQELETHGLIQSAPWDPRTQGRYYELPQSANYEKHIRFGVTTVFDMHSNPWPASYMRRSNGHWHEAVNEEQRDLKKQFLVYADLFYPSMWAMPHNVQFHYFGVDPVYNLQPVGPWTEQDVYQWVLRRKNEGASHIKIFYEAANASLSPPNVFTPATVAALADSAHKLGLLAVSHLEDLSLIASALDGGVDGFMHVPGDNAHLIPPELLAKMHEQLKFDVATLQTVSIECDNPYRATALLQDELETADVLPYINGLDEIRLSHCQAPDARPDARKKRSFEILLQNTAALADIGVPLLSGVDAGDEISPLVEGLSLHAEIYTMKAALQRYSKRYGSDTASTLYALSAVTSHAARAFGMHLEDGHEPTADPRGFVKPGYRADLLLLKASPFARIQNTLKIRTVWKAGYVANRRMVRPDCQDASCASRQVVRQLTAEACAHEGAHSPGP